MNQVEVKRQRIQIFSGIISTIALLVLGKILGSNGIAYIAVGIECVFFVSTLINGGVTDALGKILRGRNARGQYKNVRQIRRNTMLLQCILGVAGTVLLAAASKLLAESVFHMPYSAFLILILAPAVLLRTISSVFLGYFQGAGSELPTAVVSVIRPVFWLGLALVFGNILKDYGEKVSSLLGKTEFTAMYAGAGTAIALLLAEVLVLLVLLLIYKGSKNQSRKNQEEGMKTVEPFRDLCRNLYGNMGISILLRLIAGLPLCLGTLFFFRGVADLDAAAESFGLFFGKYVAGLGMLIFLFCGLLLPICSKTVACLKKEERRHAKKSFQNGIHIAWAGTIFFAVIAAVLAEQLAHALNGGPSPSLESMIRGGSSLIIFAVFAFYFGKILVLTGKQYYILGSLGVMNILFVIAAAVFLNIGNAGILSLVYAGLISTFVLAGMLGFYTFRQLRAGLNPIPVFLIPAGAVMITGLVCMLFARLLTPHLGNLATALMGFVLSFLIFWGILLVLRNFREQELAELYKFHKRG